MEAEKIKAALIGLAVGDALGVPVEFQAREILQENPVTDMRAFGVDNQAAGTWSDDSSMAFCLAESLARKGFAPADACERFVRFNERFFNVDRTNSSWSGCFVRCCGA